MQASTARVLGSYTWTPRPEVCPCIVSAGFNYGAPPRQLDIHTHPNWVMDYEYGSFGRYRVGGPGSAWHPRRNHVLHLYAPHARIYEDSRLETEPHKGFWILVNGGTRAGLRRFIQQPSQHALIEDPGNRLGILLDRISSQGVKNEESGFWRAQALLCEMLSLLDDAYRIGEELYRLEPEGVRPPPTLATRVEELLATNLATPRRIAEIAHELAMSESALYHRLRGEGNETFTQIYTRLRIREAKRLLLEGRTLKEIADRTGFCNEFHFSATFKRQEGVSPRAFRQMRK